MPKTREKTRLKYKQRRDLFKELTKRDTMIFLNILKDNPDGLTYAEVVTEFMNRGELITTFSRMSLVIKRLIELGYITKRKRVIINMNIAITRKLNKREWKTIYYLELPGKNLLLKINEFDKIIEQATQFKIRGIHETCPGTEVI